MLLEGAGVQSRKQQQHHHHKLEVYTKVLARLHAAEERAPGFDDDLWSHFNRLPARLRALPSSRSLLLTAAMRRC